eukprot:1158360-Pelagomonas_calceolata.AAC.7
MATCAQAEQRGLQGSWRRHNSNRVRMQGSQSRQPRPASCLGIHKGPYAFGVFTWTAKSAKRMCMASVWQLTHSKFQQHQVCMSAAKTALETSV